MNAAETIPGTHASRHTPAGRFLLHAGFVLTGALTTLLGPILPLLSFRWLLSDAQAGSLFAAQFAGSLFGVLSVSWLLPRRGFRMVLVTGYWVMAAGVAWLGLSPWPMGWLATFAYGIGLGLVIPATNLFVSDAAPQRRAAALSILNLYWGIGAVACPLVISSLGPRVNLSLVLVSLGGVLAVFALTLSIQGLSAGRRLAPSAGPSSESRQPIAWSGHAVALAALFFLYVGTENALSGWVSTHAKRVDPAAEGLWIITTSAFWAALLAGRAAAPLALRFCTEARLAAAGLVLAASGTLWVLISAAPSGVRLGAAAAGLGLAPVFPIFIAWLGQQFGADAARPGGVMFGLASCGGATLPWLVGVVSTLFDSLPAGLAIPLASCLLMLALLWRASPSRRSGGASAASQNRCRMPASDTEKRQPQGRIRPPILQILAAW